MPLLTGRESDAATRVEHVVLAVHEPDGGGGELVVAALELEPVAPVILVDAEAKWHLAEQAWRRQRLRLDGGRGERRDERADREGDLLRGVAEHGVPAEHPYPVGELRHSAADVAEGEHEID